MEHDGTGEQTFFRFEGQNFDGYPIPTSDGDNRVTARVSPWGVSLECTFNFFGHDGYGDEYGDWPPAGRLVSFVAGYGITYAAEGISVTAHPIFLNQLRPIQATLTPPSGARGQSGSRVVTYEDAYYGTSAGGSSWGKVKEGERP